MQPSSVRTNAAPGAPQPQVSFSVVDSLDAIKQEYESLRAELSGMRNQRDELELKLESQVAELDSLRRSLFELETQHARVRQQFADEMHHMRSELRSIQQSGQGQTPTASFGVSGRSPRGLGVSDSSSNIPSLADSQRPMMREDQRSSSRGTDVHPDSLKTTRGNEGDLDRDPERLYDHRDPKRHKARRDHPGISDPYPSPMGTQPRLSGASGAVKPLPSQNNTLGLYRFPTDGAPGSSTAYPPMNLVPPVQELTLQSVPPECRKEGGDWYAVYNPKVKKALDINLVHTFVHETVVCCVQFSADGRFLATGCNRTAQIFDVQTGAKVCVIEDDTAPKSGDLYIRSVRFSPDGKLLATGAEDRKIRIWDISKRKVRHVFDGHQQEIYSLDFSRDGRHIVSGSGDRTMRIWDIVDKSCRTITISDTDSLNNDAGVTSVAISPDGSMVAAGSLDTVVRIWDIASGTLLERLRGHDDSVYSVAFTPDGRGIVSGSLDKTLKFWDITSVVNDLSRSKHSPASGNNALVAQDRSPANPSSSSSPMNFVGHKDFVLSASVSNDGRWVISGSKDRCVHFWDSRNAALQFLLQGHKNSVISLHINPLGGMLATGSGDNTARICTSN
ncbi:WD40-repeat-containing domain protein [Flammula alnicola]|nr:WD40-repeat-containing domain protein [Flammula alnicola]